jgi:hypothetical protein
LTTFQRRKLGHNGETALTSKYFAAIPGGRPWTLSVALPGSVVTEYVQDSASMLLSY